MTLLTALFALLLTGGIFLFAFQAFLLKGVNAMLDAKTKPIEKELEQFKTEVNVKFKEVNVKFTEINVKFTEINVKLKEVNTKLDKLLSKQ